MEYYVESDGMWVEKAPTRKPRTVWVVDYANTKECLGIFRNRCPKTFNSFKEAAEYLVTNGYIYRCCGIFQVTLWE